MESTGVKNRIQVSEDTANLLVKAGKESWLVQRKDRPFVKGKNSMQTYWLKGSGFNGDVSSSGGSSISADPEMFEGADFTAPLNPEPNLERAFKRTSLTEMHSNANAERTTRLISWNVEKLLRMLKKIVARRNAAIASGCKQTRVRSSSFTSPSSPWTLPTDSGDRSFE